MAKSINYNSVAESVLKSFTASAMGVSGFASWLAASGARSAGGRAVLAALHLKAGQEVTQKAVYNAIRKRYPFRDGNGKMCTLSPVVGGVCSPSVVSVVSVPFIAALLEGGAVVSLPAFVIRKGGKFYGVASDYVREGVNLADVVRQRKETARVATEDLQSCEVSHSRAVARGGAAIEIDMALKAVGAAAATAATASKNLDAAAADWDAWRGGLAAFVK